MTEELSLSDRYAILLDDLVKENKRLHQQLEENGKKNDEMMASLVAKVDSIQSKVTAPIPSRVRQTGRGRLYVPRLCSVSNFCV